MEIKERKPGVTEHRAFLESILETPEDDVPRLIYADWLEDHGDHDRAEFIRLQIQEEKTARYSLQWDEMQARINELQRRYRAHWVADLPEWAASIVQFRRGFPAHIH